MCKVKKKKKKNFLNLRFVVGVAGGVEESDVRVPQSVDGPDDLPAGVVVSVSVYAISMHVPDSGTVFSILTTVMCVCK